MTDREHDRALLSTLPAGCRAEMEGLVDIFVAAEVHVLSSAVLQRAADQYEDAARRQPSMDGITGLLFAAILRERAAALPM